MQSIRLCTEIERRGTLSLKNVLSALNDADMVAAPSMSRAAGEGGVDPARVAAYSTDEAYDAPMMIMSQINEA
jgi:hypothetical protein